MAAAVLCGCSSQDEASDSGSSPEQAEMVSVVFRLQSNSSTVSLTRTAEDSYSHVQGTADEYAVKNARVYMYDNTSKHITQSLELTNLKQSGVDSDGNVTYESDHVLVPQGTFDFFVVANSDKTLDYKQESEFIQSIDSLTYASALIEDISKGILMTNRASDNLGISITKKENNADNVISVKLERVLARLDVAKSQDSYELTDQNNTKYATVSLTGFYIVNLPKYYYNFRHTAVLTSVTAPTWDINTNFGAVDNINGYVIDPYFFKKSIDASLFTNADKYYEHFYCDVTSPTAVKWTSFNAAAATPNYVTCYSLENCMLAPAQNNGYSTGIIFKAKLEPYNNLYHLNASNNLELTSVQPDVLYYYNYKFYDSVEALAKGIGTTADQIGKFHTLKFEKSSEGYLSFYRFWIRHEDNFKSTEMGVMEFGIVRNNLYRMLVTNISGLGDGTPIPIGPPFPSNVPDEGQAYLKVMLYVKPWIVRDQTNIEL